MERQGDPGNTSVIGTGPGGRPAEQSGHDLAEVVTLNLPPQATYIRLARLVAAGLANELGFDVERLDDVRLAVGEACGLAVQHGAVALTLRYELVGRNLVVNLDAPATHATAPDDEQRAFVAQVLAVACTEHHLDITDRNVSVQLTFTDGL